MALNANQFQLQTKPIVQRFETTKSNKWYDPNKEYLKVSVVEDGVYHLSYSDFSQSGMNVFGLEENSGLRLIASQFLSGAKLTAVLIVMIILNL